MPRSAPFPGSNPKPYTSAQLARAAKMFAEMDARAVERQMVDVSEAETATLMRMTRRHGALDFDFGPSRVRVRINGAKDRWAFDWLIASRTAEATAPSPRPSVEGTGG